MASSWIKIEVITPDKPEIFQMAEILNIDPDAVLGKMIRVWAWADQQTIDGNAKGNAASVTRSVLDRVTCVSGFANALIDVGWLAEMDGRLFFPNHERHNGETSKKRALTNRRVAKSRDEKRTSNAECNASSVTDTYQKALPEEEEEEDKELKDKTLLSVAEKNQHPTKKNAAGSYPDEFETLWHEYPKREGGNPKNKAHSCWKARKLEGVSTEAMLEGTRRYRQYCEIRGQAGTEFVMQAQRFYGKERAFENDWQVNTGGLNHAKNIASTIGNTGESIAERQLRAGREQWARERGHTGMAPVGPHDQNLQHPMGSEEWQSAFGPLGKTDRGYDE
ncbi:hypothetical protein J1785_21795 [Rahnella sp. SL6]|uniref:hypothetical protein n=1 Tax=Rahnella perminowiae TaxID=2816244 RepID=UPI001C25F927|nr:hypothetical protein [Rahnella perminowiae]MBU9812350.1 hypothetical protein [Rahnella perminowiae]